MISTGLRAQKPSAATCSAVLCHALLQADAEEISSPFSHPILKDLYVDHSHASFLIHMSEYIEKYSSSCHYCMCCALR